jgi:hypothetical protein
LSGDVSGLLYISHSKFHFFVENSLRYFRCDNVKQYNDPDEQKERKWQRAESKNLGEWSERYNQRYDNN